MFPPLRRTTKAAAICIKLCLLATLQSRRLCPHCIDSNVIRYGKLQMYQSRCTHQPGEQLTDGNLVCAPRRDYMIIASPPSPHYISVQAEHKADVGHGMALSKGFFLCLKFSNMEILGIGILYLNVK